MHCIKGFKAPWKRAKAWIFYLFLNTWMKLEFSQGCSTVIMYEGVQGFKKWSNIGKAKFFLEGGVEDVYLIHKGLL